MLQRLVRYAAIVSFAGAISCAQNVTTLASVQQVDLRMLQGGPLPMAASIDILVDGEWTAATSDVDVVTLDKTEGSGKAAIAVRPAGWRAPGDYSAEITVSSGSEQQTIPVTLEVIARSWPKFTYLDGPHDCTDVADFAPGNAAICSVPDEKPPGEFAPPGVGETYTDPNFGATVRVIAEPRSVHGYSTPSPISANSKYVLLSENDNLSVVELLTGRTVRDRITTIGLEGSVWDAVNENYLYGYSRSRVLRYDVSSGKTSTVVDYSGRFQSVTSRGTAEKSKDNWIAFHAPQENQVCALDLNTTSTYCGELPAGTSVDYPTMAKGIDRITGKRYVVVIVNGPFMLFSVNEAEGRLDLEERGPENVLMSAGDKDGICEPGEACINGSHSDTMEDSQGDQYLVTALEGQSPCEYSLYSIRFNSGPQMGLPVEFGGGLKRLMPMFRCGGEDHWVDFHTGCATQAPDCVISTTMSAFNRTRDPEDESPLDRTPYMGEIFVVHDNGAEIRRLAEHRSIQFSNEEANGYWSTARASISADGGHVVATSNFGNPNQQRVIVVHTGFTEPALVAGNPVLNGASYEPWIAPEGLAIVFGEHLAGCTQAASYPLPLELCGVSVKVDGVAAPLVSVTPGQIAFLVPKQVPTSGDVLLEVTAPYTDRLVELDAVLPDDSITAIAPAIFARVLPDSGLYAALVFDVDWKQRPLAAGDYGIVFAIGLGLTNPPVALGDPSPLTEPLARLVTEPELYINDVRQPLVYAGLVPGLSGIYQLVFQMDAATLPRQDYDWIWLNLKGIESKRLLIDLQRPI